MDETDTSSGWLGIALVWAIALIGAVVVVTMAYAGNGSWFGDTSPGGVYGALGVVLAASVVGALIVQLATRRPEGFVGRVSWSITGAIVIALIAALSVAPLAVAGAG
ncbi:hypothetical protein [Agromyces laixinhei]|uniref:hypothetical protein n=1 Tax=Agromyces laixinhei TaxID=2585717 RepID=UPI001116BDB8|nr:hypothetical protein [Agromyces laixinhei]